MLLVLAVAATLSTGVPGATATPAGRVAPSRVIGQAATGDACALFSVEELGKVVGRQFRSARPGTSNGSPTCAYQAGMGGALNVTISPSGSKEKFDEFRALLKEQGETVEAIPGVGDDAFFWGAHAYVRAGPIWLVAWNSDMTQPEDRARAEVLALVKAGAEKLR